VSGNSALSDGGGIYSVTYAPHQVSLNNVTISNNTTTSGVGGGIRIYETDPPPVVSFQNTIIADNSGADADCVGVLTSQGYNLLQTVSSGCTITGDLTGNLTGVSPNLGPLANNGGPTWTHVLLPDSPAIDAGNPSGCTDSADPPNFLTTDQRGELRPQGAACDIGAYEVQQPLAPLAVLSPNGGEIWAIDSTQTIQWNPGGVSGKVKIEISRDGGQTWTKLVSNTVNDGAYDWKVKSPISDQVLIRISSLASPSNNDTSDGVFTLGGGSVTVLVPNGGETLPISSKQTIQWSSSGLGGKVKIELSRDGGTTWVVLFSNAANTGSKAWKVAKPATTQARIRVSGVSDTGAVDISDANFTIQ